MGEIIGAIVLGVIAIIFFVVSYLQFNEKGFLFNNAYIYASKQERKNMDKKPHYKQSGIIFVLIGIIFGINAVDMILQTAWLFYLVIGIVIVAIVYAVVSSLVSYSWRNSTISIFPSRNSLILVSVFIYNFLSVNSFDKRLVNFLFS